MDKVNTFLQDLEFLSPEKAEIVACIRNVFKKSNHDLFEEIKYGGLAYSIENVLVGGIYSYKDHVSIEFSYGVDFPDPSRILEGGGKKRRHIKIKEQADIESKDVASFIKLAVTN